MTKIERRTSTRKDASLPDWIQDKSDQEEWNGRFIRILNRDYGNLDSAISAILDNEKLAQMCGVKIRSYVDKPSTGWLYAQRKARGAKHKKQLEIALTGINAAIGLYRDRSNETTATYLGGLANELSGELGRCKTAFACKRHGRDRAHSILDECQTYLESRLSRSVSCVTLANLVNAGFEADVNSPKEPVTEEHIRKNLTSFRRNNPFWRNEIHPRFVPALVDPATK